ncbi:MAG: hypothetical protein IIC79_00180 [Chloroflexi bacterium]|nr:hypothetical protein [Chloroflexota bacterium]
MSFVPVFFGIVHAKDMLSKNVAIDINALVVIFIVSLIVGILGLISHSSGGDQFLYTPNAVYMLNNPEEPMSFELHFFESGEDCNIGSLSWGTSNSFEYTRAVFARIFNLNFLTSYFLVTSFVVSFLIPLAIYLALHHFTKNTLTAAISTLFTIGVLLLLGETQRTFGNFTITKAADGKTLLLAVGIPLFISMTFNYFRYHSRLYWLFLMVISTALVGASSSTIFLLPALAIVLVISHYFISNEPRDYFKQTIYYGLSFGYLVLYALFLATSMTTDFSPDSPINVGYPVSFFGHLSLFINPDFPITPIVLVIFTILAIILTQGRLKTLLIVWVLSAILLFLNPLISPLIIRYITSSNVYWRLFYILPFPLVIGIAAGELMQMLSRISRSRQVALLILSILVFISPHFFSGSSSVLQTTEFRIPPTFHKLPNDLVNIADKIINIVPEGSMLTPKELSGIIPMLSSEHPQVVVKSKETKLWLAECGKEDLADLRLASYAFIGGDVDKLPDFQEYMFVEGKDLTSVVLKGRVLNDTSITRDLTGYMFANSKKFGSYIVFWK